MHSVLFGDIISIHHVHVFRYKFNDENILLKIGIITCANGNVEERSDKSKPSKVFAFTTVHVLKSTNLSEYKAFSSFDSNANTALVDNCANTHIWNCREQFTNFRNIPKTSQGVSTIGGQPHIAQGIGDVPTSWRDDDGKVFHHTLKDALYFSDSPVKIISPTKIATEWGPGVDAEGTAITSKYYYSLFIWKRTCTPLSPGIVCQ